MVDHTDPNTWTKQYVASHRKECLSFLQETSLLIIRYIRQGNYKAAVAGLDRILNGMITMQNSKCGNYYPFLYTFSMVEGILLASMGSPYIKNAIKVFEDARDFAQTPKAKQSMDAALLPLKAGKPIDLTPDDAIWFLEQTDSKFSDAISDPNALNRRPSQPSDSSRPSISSSPMEPKFKKWMDDSDFDEDDLDWLYRRVKFRRNLYGILLLFPPLGILICPFWMRALFLTKAIRFHSFDVKPTFLAYGVFFLYSAPTLFIYPIIMAQIIIWTNWGMGLGDRRALIPIFITLVLIGLLLFSGSIRKTPVIGDIAALPGEILSTWKDSRPSDSGASVSDREQTALPHEEPPAGVADGSALSDGQNGEGGQIPADTLDPQENAYLWPTNSQYITDADLDGFSRKEIMLMRNELYARYGCSFRDEEIRNYFLSRDWYTPDPELLAVNFSIELFNDYEKANLNTILSYERMKGWRE